MKNKIFLIILFSLISSLFNYETGYADDKISAYIDFEPIMFNVSPIIEEGTTLVQMRPIFAKLGLTLVWDSEKRTIIGKREGLEIKLEIGNKIATVNNNSIILPVAPSIIEGSTLVPIRFISEASGTEVIWDNQLRHILIFTKNEELLSYYIQIHDSKHAQELLNTQLNFSYINKQNTSLLETAINSDQPETAIELINKGINIKINNSNGDPIIFSAIQNQQLDVVNALINAGVDLKSKEKEGNTSLQFAQALFNKQPNNVVMSRIVQLLEYESFIDHVDDLSNPVKITSENNNELSLTVNSLLNAESGFVINIDIENISNNMFYLEQEVDQYKVLTKNEQLKLKQLTPLRNSRLSSTYMSGNSLVSGYDKLWELGNGQILPHEKAHFDLIFEPLSQDAHKADVTLQLASINNNVKKLYNFTFRLKPDKEVKALLTTTDIEKFIQEKYPNLNTSIGNTQITYYVVKSRNDSEPYDYLINIHYDINFQRKFAYEQISSEDRESVKKELLDFQEKFSKEILLLLPTKKIKGNFDWSAKPPWVETSSKGNIIYKNYSWSNYEYPVLPDGIGDQFQHFIEHLYDQTKPTTFRWIDFIDGIDKNFK